MKYDIILLDADETLMDFPDAEHKINKTSAAFRQNI